MVPVDDDDDGDFNEKIFQLACQNQDLAILKLLVQKASPSKKSKIDIEMNPLNEPKWKEWLFGNGNLYLTQTTEFASYLRMIYRNEFGTDYQISSKNDFSTLAKSSDKLQDAKALYELQMQDGNLNLNMELNTSLKLLLNIEFLNLNNKKHFETIEYMNNPLMKLIKHDNDEKVVEMLDSYIALFKSNEDFPKILFQSSVNHSNLTLILHLVNQFPNFVKDKQLFSDCEASKIYTALETYPDKFQSADLTKYVMLVFLDTVKNLQNYRSQFLLDNFPRLKIDDSLFEVDSSLSSVSAVLKTYPEQFGGKHMEDNLVQAFQNSNIGPISSFIDSFQCLSQDSVPEGMCKYAIAKSNIHVIYQIIDKL